MSREAGINFYFCQDITIKSWIGGREVEHGNKALKLLADACPCLWRLPEQERFRSRSKSVESAIFFSYSASTIRSTLSQKSVATDVREGNKQIFRYAKDLVARGAYEGGIPSDNKDDETIRKGQSNLCLL